MSGQEQLDEQRTRCAWWAACTRPAATTRAHPILGAVPICGPCDARVGRMNHEHASGAEAAP